MEAIKNKFSDALFFVFYIALYVLQMLPHFAIMFFETNSVLFWSMCVVGVASLIVQQIKFPCFTTRIWGSAMIWATIMAVIFRGVA